MTERGGDRQAAGGTALASAGARGFLRRTSGRDGTVGSAQMVDIRDASRSFGAKAALSGVDLHVEPGTFLVLLGPSGSGKTTLLRCLAGIERLGTGTIAIGGTPVAGPALHLAPESRRLAMVFQDYALWPHMTVLRNVMFALRRLGPSSAEARKRATSMLERVDLVRLKDRYPNELSGGEQQRVALARALVARMGLVLFDEPLSNLDADLREQLRLEIATLTRESGATSIYITHDQAEAFALADRVGVLRNGRLVQLGTPEEVYRRPVDAFVARFTGVAAELAVGVEGMAGPGSANGHLGTGGLPTARVRLPAGTGGAVVAASAPAGLPAEDHGRLFIRPSGAHIVAPTPDVHLRAEIVDAAFCGRGYEHAMRVPGGPVLTRVFSEHRWGRGSLVGVLLDPSACFLLPAGDVDDPGTGATGGDGTATREEGG
ncbi:MAG TPA: ABC transporter ATP-binding protein [Acidimicrobiales bacterium]|nr:ABC transporter ATP-binding protein [Acidimicrobiales bacterium]